jgi:hypothetical protein
MVCRIRSIASFLCLLFACASAHASDESLTFRKASDGRFVAAIDGISDGSGCAPEYQPVASVDVADGVIAIDSPEDALGCFIPMTPRPYEVLADLGVLSGDRYDVVWSQPGMPDLTGVLVRAAVGNLVPNPDFDGGLDGWSIAVEGTVFSLDDETGLPDAPSLHLAGGEVQSSCIAIDDSAPVDLRMLVDRQGGEVYATIQPYSEAGCMAMLDPIAVDTSGMAGAYWQSLSLTGATLPAGTNAVRIRLGAYLGGLGEVPDVHFDHVAFGAAGSVPDGMQVSQEGLTGTWYDPATSGQGFEFEIHSPNAIGGFPLFGAWYTYDLGGISTEQRWYSLQSVTPNPTGPQSFTIYRNTGGNFAAPPETTAERVGTGTLAFYSCTSGLLSYAFDPGFFSDVTFFSGSIPIRRLMPNVECDEDGPTVLPHQGDFGVSGAWYDLATSGQGFMIEVNPQNARVFFGWYTYAESGAAEGVHGQRWFSGQGAYEIASATMEVVLYASTGGTFGEPGGVTTAPVGTATLSFTSCTDATLVYAFNAGEMSGRSGTIALTRLGAALASCRFAN